MSKVVKLTDEQKQKWIRDQYQAATKYLAEKGVVTHSVQDTESRHLVPLFALWKLTSIEGKSYWVLSGDLPKDHIGSDMAPNGREALRHFSLKWQMQAENLLKSDNEEQHTFANLLVSRAERLYELCENDSLWQSN